MSNKTVGIVGAGNMGRGIIARMVRAGHSVLIFDRIREKAEAATLDSEGRAHSEVSAATLEEVLRADFIVLAVRYPMTTELAAAHKEQLAGKILIDISNPVDSTYTRIDLPTDTSGAELLAEAVPDSRVVKAFNTLPAPTLGAGTIDDMQLDCFVASDDEDAADQVMSLLEGSGLRALSAGKLDNARVLERMTAFGIELGRRYGLGFEFGFKFLPTEQLTRQDRRGEATA
jgi:hypothetical protein